MRNSLLQLWRDDGGALIVLEFILFVVILLLGLIVGFVGLRNAIVAELHALANAVIGLSVCFSFSGLSNCEASVCGSEIRTVETQILEFKTPATSISTITVLPCQ
jgi:hypothetical protein